MRPGRSLPVQGMREAVSEVLASRAKEADGLSRMVLYSLMAHVVLVTVLAVAPRGWLGSQRESEDATPVMISLDGAPGQDTGGQTQVAASRVQEVGPVVRERFTPPPATRTPEMVAPVVPEPKPSPKPKPVEKPAPPSRTRKPVTGEEVRSGASRVDTRGAAVPFGGLSQSGGTGLSAQNFGLENFCCPEYVQIMVQSIRRNWSQNQGATGQVVVKYTIRRDGVITNVEVTKPSGNFILDNESRRAVLKTAKLPPLPDRYTGQHLTIHLEFQYQR